MEKTALEQLKGRKFESYYSLSPEEIGLLKQAKKEISDKVEEMIKNDPMLFKSE